MKVEYGAKVNEVKLNSTVDKPLKRALLAHFLSRFLSDFFHRWISLCELSIPIPALGAQINQAEELGNR